MKTIYNFLEKLVQEMEDFNWRVVGIVEIKELKENNKIVGIDETNKKYVKQGKDFIKQWTGYDEDDFHGYLLKPLDGNKYLKIYYEG